MISYLKGARPRHPNSQGMWVAHIQPCTNATWQREGNKSKVAVNFSWLDMLGCPESSCQATIAGSGKSRATRLTMVSGELPTYSKWVKGISATALTLTDPDLRTATRLTASLTERCRKAPQHEQSGCKTSTTFHFQQEDMQAIATQKPATCS